MKIEINNKPQIKSFKEIEVGECFKYNDLYYMKVMSFNSGKKAGVDLGIGIINNFDDEDHVIALNNIRVVMGD